eukprot:m.49366 g.49366  ORF g.49366 m.49366 type:complete len:553 (+) comp7112_c0_seq1:142-1800(+)
MTALGDGVWTPRMADTSRSRSPSPSTPPPRGGTPRDPRHMRPPSPSDVHGRPTSPLSPRTTRHTTRRRSPLHAAHSPGPHGSHGRVSAGQEDAVSGHGSASPVAMPGSGGGGAGADTRASTISSSDANREHIKRLRAIGAQIPNLLDDLHDMARKQASFDTVLVRGAAKRLLDAVGTEIGAEGCSVVLQAAGMPRYCAGALLHAAGGGPDDLVSAANLFAAWDLVENAPTLEAALVALLLCQSSGGGDALRPPDVRPLVEYVLRSHPGLDFLADAEPAFSARYIDTVIARLFYEAGRAGTEILTAADLQRVQFVDSLWQLEDNDINAVRRLWSYEHFYVLYTTFWKLDSPHHMLELTRDALTDYDDAGFPAAVIDRIMSCFVTSKRSVEGQELRETVNYFDFVALMLSDIDKATRPAVSFWFRCLDLDDDGVLSPHEIRTVYESMRDLLLLKGEESLEFRDFFCQFLDIVRPASPPLIYLADLRRCRQLDLALNMLINATKFLAEENRAMDHPDEEDDGDEERLSRWDKFVERQYDVLSSEEDGEYEYDEEY